MSLPKAVYPGQSRISGLISYARFAVLWRSESLLGIGYESEDMSVKRVLWICNCDLLRMLIYMIGIMM